MGYTEYPEILLRKSKDSQHRLKDFNYSWRKRMIEFKI